MINNNLPIYLCVNPSIWKIDIEPKMKIAKHHIGKYKHRKLIWPEEFNSKTINPRNFVELKNTLFLTDLLIIDRIKAVDGTVSIADHVNRTGDTFLRAKTPFEEFPQFPDMSKIYNPVEGFKVVTVHTLGQERFNNPPRDEDIIWSEAVGLIAPVAHYVGINVSAVGGANINYIFKQP